MSDKPIAQKLYIKPNSKFLLVNPSEGYLTRLGALPEGVVVMSDTNCTVEAIQVFVADRGELEIQLPRLKELIHPKGMMWVTYHKGT